MTTTVNTEEHETGAYLVWDTLEIAEAQVEHLKEEDPDLDEDEALEQAFRDPGLYECEWDFLLDALTDKMNEINPDGAKWHCEAAGLGWRRLNGYKTFEAENGKDLLGAILPETDCTFQIYVKQDGEGKTSYFYIVNSHHDAMGEVYEVRVEGKAPCGCGLSDCEPDEYEGQTFCRTCDQDLPSGYEVER